MLISAYIAAIPFRDNAPPPLLHIISAGPLGTAAQNAINAKVGAAARERMLAAGDPAAALLIAQPSLILLVTGLAMVTGLTIARCSRSPSWRAHPVHSGRDGGPTALCGKGLPRRGPWASSQASDRCPSSPRPHGRKSNRCGRLRQLHPLRTR